MHGNHSYLPVIVYNNDFADFRTLKPIQFYLVESSEFGHYRFSFVI